MEIFILSAIIRGEAQTPHADYLDFMRFFLQLLYHHSHYDKLTKCQY